MIATFNVFTQSKFFLPIFSTIFVAIVKVPTSPNFAFCQQRSPFASWRGLSGTFPWEIYIPISGLSNIEQSQPKQFSEKWWCWNPKSWQKLYTLTFKIIWLWRLWRQENYPGMISFFVFHFLTFHPKNVLCILLF